LDNSGKKPRKSYKNDDFYTANGNVLSLYRAEIKTGFESKLDRSRRQRPRLRWVEDVQKSAGDEG